MAIVWNFFNSVLLAISSWKDLHHRRFSVSALQKLEEDPLFPTKMLFSDEAHFWLNGNVNKQNWRIWAEEQPEEFQDAPLYPKKTTVWCGLWAGGIIAFLQSFISIDFEQILINSPSGFALLLGNSHYKDMMIMFLNKYRQNLLHVTCRLNRSDFVEPLIKLGCNPAKQDYDGRTPFHVAMDYDHMECIDIFIRVMNETENEDRKFPDTVGEITAGLKCMFKPYNHIGFTIIHQTVHKDKPLVLEHLLRFCLKHNINVLESEVLGCGDSLLHLAVKKRGYKAAKIIVELYPESVKVRNYAGILAYDLDGVVEDMRKLLKLQSR